MSIDPTTLSPRELDVFMAGYADAATDFRADLQQADTYLEQDAHELARLRAELEQTRRELELEKAAADRYYRAAFDPRPPMKPVVPLVVREQQRDDLYTRNQKTPNRPWADVETRHPAAA